MQLPDMVKQVGRINGKERVYVEDYVYTYLNELKKEKSILTKTEFLPEKVFPLRIALFGHVFHKEEQNIYLVYGAASVVEELENGKDEEQVRKEFFKEYELIGYVNIYGNKQELPGKREGYYIFYEKNEAMQGYLLACYERKNKSKTRRLSGKGNRYREFVQPERRKAVFSISETIKKLLYGECIVILALAVTTINDYNKMNGFVEAANRVITLTEKEK